MPDDTAQPILSSVDEQGIAHVRFNRPQALNAISVELAEQFLAAVQTITASGNARVVVLSGIGRSFMAGGDLQAFRAEPAAAAEVAGAMIRPLHAALELLANADAPVIASLKGAVAGAGMSLALGADFAIAGDDVKLSMAYARLGASPDGGGSWHLARLLGLRRAIEVALLCEVIPAVQAKEMGLVNQVVPAAELETATHALASRIARGPTKAFGETRRLLSAAGHRTLVQQLDAERQSFSLCAGTSDFSEGVAAFFERREPRFTGR